MKILHTSDLHIGKKLNGKTRINEQREVLFEIVDICNSNAVELVLIAGDVYDTFLPSADSEELFFEFINALATPSRAVVVISGNHDDWQRLCASHQIASKLNAYMFGGENIPGLSGGNVRGVKVDKNFIQITNGSQTLHVGVLPYPSEQRLGEKRSDLSYSERVKGWIEECFKQNSENYPQILCTHLFMLGGEKSDSEREIELGGARILSPALVSENCVYTALGHLHKRQNLSKTKDIVYSGSILQYAFDEVGVKKSVELFEIIDGKVQNKQTIELTKGKKLVSLVANNVGDAKDLLARYGDCLVLLTLKLTQPLSEIENKELVGNYPQLVEIKLDYKGSAQANSYVSKKGLSDKQLFEEYYFARYGEKVPQELMQLYLEAMQGDKK